MKKITTHQYWAIVATGEIEPNKILLRNKFLYN